MKDPVVIKLISIVFLLLFASVMASPVIAEICPGADQTGLSSAAATDAETAVQYT